jgi:hypothetical protein
MNSGGEEKETQACSTFKQQESLHYQSLVSIGFDLIDNISDEFLYYFMSCMSLYYFTQLL